MSAKHGHPTLQTAEVKKKNNDDGDHNKRHDTYLDFSLSGEENILLDQETLANVADFIDKLHRTRRDHTTSSDRNSNNNKEGLSPRNNNASDRDSKLEMDARTKSSVGRFISVLSQEEEELAAEFSEVVRSVSFDEDFEVTSVNPNTLEAIGQYIDTAAKHSRIIRNDSASLTDSSSHEMLKKNDGSSKEGVLESLGHFTHSSRDGSSVVKHNDQILPMDDMSETSGIEPDALAAIGDYIDGTRSRTSKGKKMKNSRSKTKAGFRSQNNETPENGDDESQIAMEESVSEDTIDRFDLPKETLETIGEYIDSVSLPPNASASCYSGANSARSKGVNSRTAKEGRTGRRYVEDVLDNSREEGVELLSESIDLEYRTPQNGSSGITGEQGNNYLDSNEHESRTNLGGYDTVVSSQPAMKQRQDASLKSSPPGNQTVLSTVQDADSTLDVDDDQFHQKGVPSEADNFPNHGGNQFLSQDDQEKMDGKVYDDNTITTKGTLDVDPHQFDHFVEEIEALKAEEGGELNSIEALDEIFSEVDRGLFSESASTNLLAMIEDYVDKFTAVQVGNDETTYDSSKVPEEARAVVSEFIDLVQKKKTLAENKVKDFESRLPEHLQQFRLKQPGVITCPKDPPSNTPLASKTSNSFQRDPPIKMTSSEENRIFSEHQPERNLKAQQKRRTKTDLHKRDPDLTSAEPLFDTTGELAKKTTRNTSKDSLQKEHIRKTRNKKSTALLSGRKELVLASIEEKKDESNPEDSNQPSSRLVGPKLETLSEYDPDTTDPASFTGVIWRLARLLSPLSEPSVDEMKKLANVVSYAYPHVKGKSAPASSVARILCEARNRQLDLHVVDRFLNLAHAYFEAQGGETDIETVPSDELIAAKASWTRSPRRGQSVNTNEVFDYIKRIVDFGEANLQFSLVEEDEEDVDLIITTSGEGEAIEIDLKDGFVNKEMALGATGETPWWEVAARLSGGSSVGASDDIFTSESEKADDPPSAGESAECHQSDNENDENNEDFKKYWEKRQERTWKPFGYPSKTIEENEHFGLIEQRTSDEWATPSLSTGVSTDSLEEAWTRRQSMALWKEKSHSIWTKSKLGTVSVDDPRPINAVAATADMFVSGTFRQRMRKQLPLTQQWKRTYQDRTEDHKGFFGVHVYSLYDATCPENSGSLQDGKPWEYRIVKQRFLHEQSVSFCKNWFGVLLPRKGNPVAKNPVVRIQSMPMPIKANEWSEDWYQNPWVTHEAEDSPKDKTTMKQFSYFNSNVDDISLLEAPECGRIRNTRLKIGERITRVTPDLTSSLRRSRWRKKYFPRGTFPY